MRRIIRDRTLADINGDSYRPVDALASVIVSGAREASGLQEVEFEGTVERV